MRIVVIIPTCNERGNIENLLAEIESSVISKDSVNEWLALIVDGNSTDGTVDAVLAFAQSRSWLHLFREPAKRGLAYAYVDGMRYAIDTLAADAVVEMDGDGQHDPRTLLTMAEVLNDGADCVIGSRYIPGGSVPREWTLSQHGLSRFGSLYCRLLLGLPVRDATSGFKMTRVSDTYAARLPLDPSLLLTRGYAYKIQFLHELWKSGARLREIPIIFRYRKNGSSKSTPIDIVESLKVTTILRLRTLRDLFPNVRSFLCLLAMFVAATVLYIYLAPHADLIGDASLNLSRAVGWLDYFGPGQYSPLQWSGYTWWWTPLSFQDYPPLGFLLPHLFFALFGDTTLIAHIPYVIGFIVSAVVAYWFIKRLEGIRVALISTGIFLFSSFSVYTVLRAHPEGLEIPFIIGSVLAFVWYLKRNDVRFFYLSALCTGLALSTKYTALFLLPPLVLLSLYQVVPREEHRAPRITAYAYALLIAAICTFLGAYISLVIAAIWLLLLIRMVQSKEVRYLFLLVLFTGLLFVSPYLAAVVVVPAFLLLLLSPSIPFVSIVEFFRTHAALYLKAFALIAIVLFPVILYNLCLYITHGTLDSSLAAILGTKNDLHRSANFLIATGLWNALKNVFQSGSILFMLYVTSAFFWLLYKNFRGKASLLEQATIVYSLFALLMISFMAGEERFTAILIPFIALTTALATRDLLAYTPRLGTVLVVLVMGSEVFCMFNIFILPQPLTTSPLAYSANRVIQDDGYNELDSYIRSVMAPLPKRVTPTRFVDIPQDKTVEIPLSASRIILYDARFPWFESWWYLERYRIYYRLPVISTTALRTHPDILSHYPQSAKGIEARADTVVYYIYTEQQRDSSHGGSQEDTFARTLDEERTPFVVITNRAGVPEFRVYRLVL